MTYVARFSSDIQWDIERGFSCWGDKSTRQTDLDIVQEIGGFWDDEELEAKQQRWISTYGEQYEDYDLFIEELAREIAPADLVRDEKYGTWAEKHHDGLSCFALQGETEAEAIAYFCNPANRFDPMLGDTTVGVVEYVKSFDHEGMTFHLLKCDSVEEEELLD